MRRPSYAVWWEDDDERRRAGKLEVAALHMLISGSEHVAVPLDEIRAAEYGGGEVRIERAGHGPLRIGSLDAPGTLLELFDSLRLKLSAA